LYDWKSQVAGENYTSEFWRCEGKTPHGRTLTEVAAATDYFSQRPKLAFR